MDQTHHSDFTCKGNEENTNIIVGGAERLPTTCRTDSRTDAHDDEADRQTTEVTTRTGVTAHLVDDRANRNVSQTEVNRPMATTSDRMGELMGRKGEVETSTKEFVTDGVEIFHNDAEDEEVTEQTDTSTERHQYGNPVDQEWAWVVLIGCFGISMFTIGGLKSFGVLYVELTKKFQVSNQALSSVQSLAGFCYLFFAPVCNALSTRFTHRVVIFVGGIMTSSGLILSSLARSVVVLYFTYGLITGIGFSMCFSSSVVMVANYFLKYRAFATGLSLSGGGLGAMALPYLIRYFINQYGLEGAMLIYAGIMSNICVCAMCLRPFTNHPQKIKTQQNSCTNGDREQETLIKQSEPKAKCKSSSNENTTTVILCEPTTGSGGHAALLPPHHSNDHTEHTRSRLHLSNASINAIAASISCQCYEASTNTHVLDNKPTQKKFFLREIEWKLFRNPVFTVFFVLIFFSMVGYHSLFNIVPPFADEIGLSGEDGALILLVFGATDLIGRIAFGILMDIFPNHRHAIFTTCVAVCAVGVILTPLFRSTLTLSLFMASYGCFAGGFNSTATIMVIDKVGLKMLPSAWGFICLSASIAMLINPWASGLIKDSTGTWAHAFRFTGSMSVMAIVLLLILPFVERWHRRRNEVRV